MRDNTKSNGDHINAANKFETYDGTRISTETLPRGASSHARVDRSDRLSLMENVRRVRFDSIRAVIVVMLAPPAYNVGQLHRYRCGIQFRGENDADRKYVCGSSDRFWSIICARRLNRLMSFG